VIVMTLRKALKSKTIWFSIILAIFGVLEASTQYLQDMIDPKFFGFVVIVIGMITAILRVVTTLPLDEK